MLKPALRIGITLFILAALTYVLTRDPVPINIILLGLAWLIGLGLALRPASINPNRGDGCLIPAIVTMAGGMSFGYATLFAIAHSMDPIGPKAEWFPFAFFGGLLVFVIGFVLLLARRV